MYINVTNKRVFRKFLKTLTKDGYKLQPNIQNTSPFWAVLGVVNICEKNKTISWQSRRSCSNFLTFPKDKTQILQKLNIQEDTQDYMTTNYNYIVTDNSITLFAGAKPYIARKEHVNFEKIKNLIKRARFGEAVKLFDVLDALKQASKGKITIKNDVVYWQDKPLHSYAAQQLLKLMRESFDIKPLVNFLEDLYNNNPLVKQDNNHYLVEDLYKFLSVNNLPCTKDGGFLAWKRVREDGFDIHSGTVQYKVGEIVEESFEKVDKNRDNHCSYGLHFAAKSYLDNSGFGANQPHKMLLIKVMPSWVCSIPSDYGNSKGRAYKMFVYAEYNENTNINLKSAVVSNYAKSPKRDSMGRFCKSA